MGRLWWLLVCVLGLLVPRPSLALTYGPVNEACTTGTPTATGGTWQTTIEAATTGQTVYVRAGTYTANGRIDVAAGVTVKPYNCEAVNVTGNWTLGANSVLAGQTLTGTQAGNLIEFAGNNVTIRNNVIIPRSDSGFGILQSSAGAISGIDILGNEFQTTYGHNSHILLNNALDIWIYRNKFVRTANPITCPGGCEDYIALQSNWNGATGQYLIIEENWFASIPDTFEGYLDLKAAAVNAVGGWRILRNRFDTTDGNNCMLLWGQAAGSSGLVQEVAGNYTNGCGSTGNSTLRLYAGPGGSGLYPRPEGAGFNVHHNVFRCPAPDSQNGRITIDTDNAVFEHNTVYQCNFEYQETSTGNPAIVGGTVRSNLFHDASFVGDTVAGVTCDRNNFFSMTGALAGVTCTNDTTANPTFVNAGAGNFNITNTAIMLNGHDNEDRGALHRPRISTCNVGTVSATTMTAEVSTQYTPVTILTQASFQPQNADVAQAIGGSSVQGNTQVRLTGLPAYASAQDADLALTAQGAMRNAQNIGGPEIALHGQSSVTTVDVQCTNTVQSTAPLVSSCVVGDTNRHRLRATLNTQGAPPIVLGGCPTGWSARDDGVANNPTSCALIGTNVIEFTMPGNFTTGTNDLSYNQATGTTTNTAGVEVATLTNLVCTNDIGTSPPTLVSIEVFNAARNTFVFGVDIGNSTTLLPATGMTGITCRKDVDGTPTALTLTQCDRTDATHFACMATEDMQAGDGLDCSYSQGTGNITDDAPTELQAFTNVAVGNEVQADAGTVTLAHSRCEFPHFAEVFSRVYGLEDQSCLRVTAAGQIRVRWQLRCAGTCPAQAYVPYASLNGAMATAVGNTFGAHGLSLGTDLVTTNLTPTTRQLTACVGAFVPGSVYLNPLGAFPTVALADTECTEYVANLLLSPTLVGGTDVLTIGLQPDGIGTGVVQTQPLVLPVSTPLGVE